MSCPSLASFYALSDKEQQKFFEDMRYTVDMGFLDDAFMAVQRLANQPDRLQREINRWPLGTRRASISSLWPTSSSGRGSILRRPGG